MLSVNSLSFAFKHRPLFSALSFEVNPTEIVHLVGPNGAGKSTLMSVLAGFRAPTSGSVKIIKDGIEQDSRSESIEYLSAEANGLYMKMDATQNLKFWSQLRGKNFSQEGLEQELEYWGLGHRLVRKDFAVEKFSTGMRRRLALARVHLSPASVWLLDEPIYGLDTKGIEKFRSILSEHKNNGGSALVISHDTAPLDGLVTKTIDLEGTSK